MCESLDTPTTLPTAILSPVTQSAALQGLGFCPRAAKMLKALRNLQQLHQEEKTHMKAGLQVIESGVLGLFQWGCLSIV